MEAILGYLRHLIIVIFFATIVEWLLPENSYRRYLKLVTGLLIILAVLAPLKELLEQGIYSVYEEDFTESAGSIAVDETILAEHERRVRELYEERLAEGIARDICQMLGLSGINVCIRTDTVRNQAAPPEIISVNVSLKGANDSSLVQPVVINLSGDRNRDVDDEMYGLKEEIIAVITRLYQIERDRIVITTGG